MSKPLLGRVAIVVGAGRGAGRSVALTLAEAGAHVCVGDLNPDRANRVAEEIVAAGGEGLGWQLDVANRFQVAALIEAARDRYNRLDILVNNAHIAPRVTALGMDEWEWRRVIEVNLSGAFFCAQLAGRAMADQGGGAIFLLVGSPPNRQMAAYAAARSGVLALADVLAAELTAQGVRVEALAPSSPEAAAQSVLARCASACSNGL